MIAIFCPRLQLLLQVPLSLFSVPFQPFPASLLPSPPLSLLTSPLLPLGLHPCWPNPSLSRAHLLTPSLPCTQLSLHRASQKAFLPTVPPVDTLDWPTSCCYAQKLLDGTHYSCWAHQIATAFPRGRPIAMGCVERHCPSTNFALPHCDKLPLQKY